MGRLITRLINLTICQSANLPILQLSSLLLLMSLSLGAADWPQFLGPTRNGIYIGTPLNEKWPAGGPRVLWRAQVGQGLSGPVVARQPFDPVPPSPGS